MGLIWNSQKFIMTDQQVQVRMLLEHGNGQRPGSYLCVSKGDVFFTSKQGTARSSVCFRRVFLSNLNYS